VPTALSCILSHSGSKLQRVRCIRQAGLAALSLALMSLSRANEKALSPQERAAGPPKQSDAARRCEEAEAELVVAVARVQSAAAAVEWAHDKVQLCRKLLAKEADPLPSPAAFMIVDG
jgi:hypothetical protein